MKILEVWNIARFWVCIVGIVVATVGAWWAPTADARETFFWSSILLALAAATSLPKPPQS